MSSPSNSALAPCAQRLSLLIPRLASNHDGEVVATVHAMRRTLDGAKADLHDLAAVVRACGEIHAPRHEAPRYTRNDDPPDFLRADNWAQVVRWTQRQPGLSDWEVGFLKSILGFSTLSLKQHACLAKIFNKMRRAAA